MKQLWYSIRITSEFWPEQGADLTHELGLIGELAGKDGGAVAVKVAKGNHDMRFDSPCIGAQTFEVCAAARIAVLALESGKSLLLEREVCEALAQKNKIAVTTIG